MVSKSAKDAHFTAYNVGILLKIVSHARWVFFSSKSNAWSFLKSKLNSTAPQDAAFANILTQEYVTIAKKDIFCFDLCASNHHVINISTKLCTDVNFVI